jgi:hypothetical protein
MVSLQSSGILVMSKLLPVLGCVASGCIKAEVELETKGLIVGRPGQGTFILATLGQVALPELTGLRRSLRGWLAKADTAGLDESGIVALVASELRDFYERRSGSSTRSGASDGESEGVA